MDVELPRFGAEVAADALVDALAVAGCAIVEGLVDTDVMASIRTELEPWVARTDTGVDDFAGHATRRTGGLLARSETARDLVVHPLVRDTVRGVLAHATSHQLHLTQLIAIGPGETAQPVHRDQWAFDFFPFPAGYEVQCNTLWAMTDFTEANGATRVIPGSHLHEDQQRYDVSDTVAAEMPAGSVLLYTGALYHGGGANRTEETRCGVNITYAVSWLRQEENQYLTVPREIAATFDEDLQRLMGYARGAYALGYVDDLRDPIELLRPGTAGSGFGDLALS